MIIKIQGIDDTKGTGSFRHNSTDHIWSHRGRDSTLRASTSINEKESQHSDAEVGMSSHSQPRSYLQWTTSQNEIIGFFFFFRGIPTGYIKYKVDDIFGDYFYFILLWGTFYLTLFVLFFILYLSILHLYGFCVCVCLNVCVFV